MVSLHAEVPAEGNILEIHDIIDNVENELKEKLGCDATIHMDPIVTSDEHVSEMKAAVISIIKGIDERINMHDFRVVTGPTHTNIIFDVLIPYKFHIQDDELVARITSQVRVPRIVVIAHPVQDRVIPERTEAHHAERDVQAA